MCYVLFVHGEHIGELMKQMMKLNWNCVVFAGILSDVHVSACIYNIQDALRLDDALFLSLLPTQFCPEVVNTVTNFFFFFPFFWALREPSGYLSGYLDSIRVIS